MSDHVNQLRRYADALEVLHRPTRAGTDPIRPQRDGPRRRLVLMAAIGLVGGVLILVSVLASKPSQTATTVESPDPSPSDLAGTTSEPTDSIAPSLEGLTDLIPEGSVAVSLNYPTGPDATVDLEAGVRIRISGIGPEGTSEVTATVLDFAADSETLMIVVPAVEAYLLVGDIHLPALRVEPIEDE